MHSWLNFNGAFIREGSAVVTAGNRGLRYGDGIFETMKFTDGAIKRRSLHFERLFKGIAELKLRFPFQLTAAILEKEIIDTIEKNRLHAARIRLMVFRGDGGLYEPDGPGGGYIIQVWELSPSINTFNENGLTLGLYDQAFKPCDRLANLKSNNYLLYAMAALYARELQYNDCLVMNTEKRICDATIANLFWVTKGEVFTPPLSEGCVAGVMREHLLRQHPSFREKQCSIGDLKSADEIFLTNAVAGLRWVSHFDGNNYAHVTARQIFGATI